MEAIAKTKYIRQSPFKIRFVADLVRGKNVFDAVNVLSLTNKNDNVYDQLVKLKELHENGVLNKEEFEKAKKKILN